MNPILFLYRRGIETWSPRVGPEAARLYTQATFLFLVAAFSSLIYTPLLIVGLREHFMPLVGLGWAVVGVAAASILAAWRKRRAYYSAATRQLGVVITFRNDIPTAAAKYEIWCGAQGITPYSAANNQQPLSGND